MKITVDSKSFADAIAWVTKNYDNKDAKAYVSLTVTDEGMGSLHHLNPTSFMKSGFQVLDTEIDSKDFKNKKFTVLLEGKYLQRFAGTLAKEAIQINVKDAVVTVETSNGKFTLPTVNAHVHTEPVIIPLGEVDDREYFDSLQRLTKLCDPGNAGFAPALGSVDIKLNPDDKNIVFMATDRYALGEITVNFDPNEPNVSTYVEKNENILLPVEEAVLIAPSKGLTSSTSLVYEEKGRKFGYSFSDGRVALFSLKDAQPLKYGNVKKKALDSAVNSFKINVADLRKAIATVSNLAWDENTIHLEITADDVVITDDKNTNKIHLEVLEMSTDADYRVTFVRSIINEAFSPIATNVMNVKWATETQPFLLEAVLDDDSVVENVFISVMPST